MGSFVATYSVFQMSLAVIFGILAFFMRKLNYSTVSLLLGFILGPDLEQYLRRSLSLSDGNPMIFLTSPDSLFFLSLTALFVYLILFRKKKNLSADQASVRQARNGTDHRYCSIQRPQQYRRTAFS